MRFYPEDAPVPARLVTNEFLLRMLSASDAALDYEAVMASKDILRLRSQGRWPHEGFTLEENLADLREHEAEFHARTSFTYTVMNPAQTQCLGCVYIYPLEAILRRAQASEDDIAAQVADDTAEVSFWARQDRTADDLDTRLLAALIPWLKIEFAFARVVFRAYAAEARQVAILQDAGLHTVYQHPYEDSQLLLFA